MTERFNCIVFDEIIEQELNVVFDYTETESTRDEPAEIYFEIISIDGQSVTHTETMSEKEIKQELLDGNYNWFPEKEDISEIYEH